jgi:alkanesulfonate monooxygenase SsuD/methylene tetrahydromethanopterin reductase-like flavin-dependent oxidoreductase (luciferase family)
VTLRFGIDVPPLGQLAEPATVLRIAEAAERHGWEAVSTWDHLAFAWGAAAAEPFVLLSAVAARTSRLRLITGVLALPRRRVGLTAQSIATLDRLSGGRLTVGVGAGGVAREFEAFGEEAATAPRIRLLDASLAALDGLLRGDAVTSPPPVVVDGVTLAPRPIQQPRPPIWIGAVHQGGLRRAARWDGWFGVMGEDGTPQTPDQVAAVLATIAEERARLGLTGPFDAAILGVTAPGALDVAAYEAAGLTWFFESLHPSRPLDELIARVEAGPPAGSPGRQ